MNEVAVTMKQLIDHQINMQKAVRAGKLKTKAVKAQNFERAVRLRELEKLYISKMGDIPHYKQLERHFND